MFKGKESLNRIELSQLVQDFLNFGVLGSLLLWGGGRWVWGLWKHLGAWGLSPHACTCMHMHTHTCKCMYRNCKWPPTWRHPCLSCLTCMCVHACVHVHAFVCAWDTPYTPIPDPTSIHPSTTPWGDPQNWSKFNNTWTNQDISIPFEHLKSVENAPSMGGCTIWWVGGWVGRLMGGIRSNH